ncbi:MobP2 family relaxase [Metasolibacillus sp.]|uniref:MobP2 family relaxase n=1 Tax=Metasolibacillus sp. TaxID=2703680 RepID=UPI0025F29E79|nr:MobP2 family relaxase [Metasolibacillus sp.]MCT6922826.1 relaxase MobL [Metasolibacillus sp.]MCT6938835.1 relaxase MobL [Metasolibacillus sp.]
MTTGVVLKSQFVMSGSDEFKEYINYIDREAAKVKEMLSFNEDESFSVFYRYMEYMGDEEKQGSLFTKDTDFANQQHKDDLKQLFELAQKNGSPLWQDVVSFDNSWLQKFGVMDATNGQVDEVRLKNIIRVSVEEMLKAEHMSDSAVWSASIHYNTDNIHVHIATVEPVPTRKKAWIKNEETGHWEEQYRAKRKQSSLDKMKSKVANLIMDRTEELNLITDLIRGSVKLKKEQEIDLSNFHKTKKLFQKALRNLPEDRSQWRYGYQSIDKARPYIDKIVDVYLEHYYKDEMNELHRLLDEEAEVMKEKYGEGSRYQNYKQTKLDDLKKRMGNAVLTELRVYDKERTKQLYGNRKSYHRSRGTIFKQRYEKASTLNYAINNLSYRLRKTFHDYQRDRNIEEFDRMLDGYDR